MRSERMNEFTLSGPSWFDALPDPVLFVQDGKVEYCNPSAAELGIAVGTPLPPAVKALLDGGETVVWLGERWSCRSQRLSNGVLVQLQRCQEHGGVTMERLGDLAQSLRKPLSDVFGAIQLLGRDGLERESAEKYLAIGSKGCHALLRMVENMEAAADAEQREYSFRLMDLGGLCARVIRDSESLVELAGCSIGLDARAGNLLIQGDDYWLSRMLYQLISNALRSAGAGGTLVLRLQKRAGAGKWAVLTLSDSGEGFEAEELERVFDPGQGSATPLDPKAGQGLGLTVCRSIIAAHGGSMMVGGGLGGAAAVQLPLSDLESEVELRTGVDYSGGINEALVQLSDALPWQCYLEKNV